MRELSLMSRFLIPMLKAIILQLPEEFTDVMRMRRNILMRQEYVKLNMLHSLSFSATGEMADEACNFYKCIAPLLCDKWSETYTSVIKCLRCCLSFSLLCSAIRCVRGSHSSSGSFFGLSWPALLSWYRLKLDLLLWFYNLIYVCICNFMHNDTFCY